MQVHLISFATVDSITVNIINTSENALPSYATAGAAGMDIRANIDTSIVLQPMQRMAVPTGLFIELPAGYEAQIRPRSGLALKQGITCLNTPGTIDADYRGEIKVILINLSTEPQSIENGDRIAQLIVQQVSQVQWVQVAQITETDRGTGGFGHTGKH
ncbi:dUTP diphosphatase [Limnovirga soli]|nr:dUTP diphosphatase [Limnovirga soli]